MIPFQFSRSNIQPGMRRDVHVRLLKCTST